jgi:hypothetical protein
MPKSWKKWEVTALVLEKIRMINNHTVFLLKMGHRSYLYSRMDSKIEKKLLMLNYFYTLLKVVKSVDKQIYEKKNGGLRAFRRIIG